MSEPAFSTSALRRPPLSRGGFRLARRSRHGSPSQMGSAACDALVWFLRNPTTLPEFLPYQPCIAVLWTTVAMTGNAE